MALMKPGERYKAVATSIVDAVETSVSLAAPNFTKDGVDREQGSSPAHAGLPGLEDLTSIPEADAGRTWCEAAAVGEEWRPNGYCAVCGDALAGQQIRYCGKAHRDWWRENHQPQASHRATLRRDKGCVRPGCTSPRGAPYVGLEVNHIIPLVESGAKRGTTGCHNHQENLETLCVDPHHREVTKAQLRAQMGGRAA